MVQVPGDLPISGLLEYALLKLGFADEDVETATGMKYTYIHFYYIEYTYYTR